SWSCTCHYLSEHCRLSFVALCFQRSGAHRDLHSFPTRRSSDLSSMGMPDPSFGASIHRRSKSKPSRQATSRWRAACGVGSTAERDRKSTRLNSSHVKISYAVFCLKKKTQKRRQDGDRRIRRSHR